MAPSRTFLPPDQSPGNQELGSVRNTVLQRGTQLQGVANELISSSGLHYGRRSRRICGACSDKARRLGNAQVGWLVGDHLSREPMFFALQRKKKRRRKPWRCTGIRVVFERDLPPVKLLRREGRENVGMTGAFSLSWFVVQPRPILGLGGSGTKQVWFLLNLAPAFSVNKCE